MKVPIEAFSTPGVWQLPGAVTLRIYANQSFWTSLGQYIPQSTPGMGPAYLEIACTVFDGVLTIPDIEIDSTVDSLDNIWATYTAQFVTEDETVVPFLANFSVNTIPDGDPSLTWGEIVLLKNSINPQSIPDSLIRQLIGQIQLAVGGLNRASTTNTGVTALNVAPLDPAFPIAVGSNDPRLAQLSVLDWHNVKLDSIGAAGDGVTDDRAALNTLVNIVLQIAGTGGDVYFPEGTYLIGSAMTFPANVRLHFDPRAKFLIATGVTVTFLSPPFDAADRQLFTNILTGQGTVSFAGNRLIWRFPGAWWGVVGDGVNGVGTDNTATLQRIIDTLFADNVEGVIVLPSGEVIIAGALQDTGASNSQIVLPKRTLAQSQYTLTIVGTSEPSMLGLGGVTAGTILRSTLGAGNGAMIGVKTTGTLGTSALNLTLMNLTFRMPVNPTNSALDLRYVMQPRGFNLRFTTGETFATWTQPTTTTSAAVLMPLENVPSTTYFENVVIDGFYIGVDVGELSRFKNLTIAGCFRAINVHPTIHPLRIESALVINCTHVIYAPDAGTTTFAWVDIDVDIERATLVSYPANPWFIGVDEINDSQPSGAGTGYLNGPITTQLDLPFGLISDALIVSGGPHVQLNHYRPYTPTWTNLTVGGGTAVVSYLKRGRQVFVRGHFTFGVGSAVSGDIRVSLPVPQEPHAGSAGVVPWGSARASDSGGVAFTGVVTRFSTTVAAVRFQSGSPAQELAAAAGVPFAWAAGDELNFEFMYESEW